jgi:hypothetical protein
MEFRSVGKNARDRLSRRVLDMGILALFAHTDWSHLCGDIGVAVGNRNVFPEGFLPTCAGGKDLCGAGAAHGL